MREYCLDFSKNRYEGSAALISILAHPTDDESDSARANLHASLCSLFLRGQAESDMEWANTHQHIKPAYAFRDRKQIARDIRQLKRRLRDRMVAAKIAIAFLQEVVTGELPKLPKGVKRLSLNEMCAHVQGDLGQDDAGNIETRIWRESLPVIHLATAIALAIDELEKAGVEAPSLAHFLMSPELTRKVIENSNEHAELLLQSKRLRILPETLIRIRCS